MACRHAGAALAVQAHRIGLTKLLHDHSIAAQAWPFQLLRVVVLCCAAHGSVLTVIVSTLCASVAVAPCSCCCRF